MYVLIRISVLVNPFNDFYHLEAFEGVGGNGGSVMNHIDHIVYNKVVILCLAFVSAVVVARIGGGQCNTPLNLDHWLS